MPSPINTQSFNRHSYVQNTPANLIDSPNHSCMMPQDALEGIACNALKETILNSTLRIQTIAQVKIEGQWILVPQTSHATVKNGNTLVSHNHFYTNYTAAGYKVNIISMELFSASGIKIPGQWKDFTITESEEATETSMLQFGNTDLLGRVLNIYGIKPATFGTATLKSGDEVGQIVLTDDFTTELRWTTISVDPIEILGVQAVLISGPINPGSSGGGIFLGEVHVANNWFTTVTNSGGALSSSDVIR